MSQQSARLPVGFEALGPFVDFWAVDSAAGRAELRKASSETERQAFYDAAKPLLPRALDYLDTKPLADLDESDQRLMLLALSFTHVSMAVELHKEKEPDHARDRHQMRITRAPADEPAAR